MPELLIFGAGYAAGAIARPLRAAGWTVTAIRREAAPGVIGFGDSAAIGRALGTASHILSSVPPEDGADPVLARYGAAIAAAPAEWSGYLSSTGVYGDTGGAWVDESAPVGGGRRTARAAADLAWGALRPNVRVFRLPGIYGPGRSAIERLRDGRATKIAAPGQVFSRVHVDDIASAVLASFEHGPPGAYNIADDAPAGQDAVLDHGCRLLGLPPLPAVPIDEAGLSPAARGFYAENRRVANGRAKRLLGWRPRYPDYAAGLSAILGSDASASASAATSASG